MQVFIQMLTTCMQLRKKCIQNADITKSVSKMQTNYVCKMLAMKKLYAWCIQIMKEKRWETSTLSK